MKSSKVSGSTRLSRITVLTHRLRTAALGSPPAPQAAPRTAALLSPPAPGAAAADATWQVCGIAPSGDRRASAVLPGGLSRR